MKIAILAQGYLFDKTNNINGTLVQLHNLSKGFTKEGIEVHYICQTKDRSKPKKETIGGIHFYWLQSTNAHLNWYHQMKGYRTQLEAIKPNALYVRGRNVMQYTAGQYAQKNKINFVWGTNGEDSAEFWKNLRRLKKSNKSLVKKILLLPLKAFEDYFINKGMLSATFVINQTIHQQKETLKYLNVNGKILPNYFTTQNFTTKKRNQILWLANLSKNKQPEKFIKLCNTSFAEDWDIVLGGGSNNLSYQTEIFNKAKQFNITTLGKVAFTDSFDLYAQSKIYVNTSKSDSDGLPNAYIQSWLLGTVVISLNHDPNNWFDKHRIGYCAKGDEEDLKNFLKYLISHPKELEQMSKRAKVFAQDTFSNSKILDSYKKIFFNNGK